MKLAAIGQDVFSCYYSCFSAMCKVPQNELDREIKELDE
jgi:hypothetical protein